MPSEYTCEICKSTVSKRKSYAYGNGRACKIHQEAQAANHDRTEEKKAKDAAAAEEAERKERVKRERSDWRTQAEIMANGCWKCRQSGITLQQYYLMRLVGLEREKIKGEFNFLTNPNRSMELSGIDKDTLLLLPYEIKSSCRLDMNSYMWTQMNGGIVQLCQHCARSAGYNPEERMKEIATPTKEIGLSQLAMIGALYEQSDMHKEISQVAEKIEEEERQ